MNNPKLSVRNNLLALLTGFSVFVSYAQNTFRINYDAALFDLPVNATEALTANNYVFSGFHTNFVPIRSSMTQVDNAGNIVWSKMYSDGSLSYMFGDFKRDPALNQYYACGGSENGPAFILFLDNTGNVVGGRRFSIAQADGAFFNKIIKTLDGGYLCVGYVIGHDPDGAGPEPDFNPVTNSDPSCSGPVTESISSPLIAKFDASGTHQWHRVFRYYNTSSAPIYNDAEFVDVVECEDGYMAVGNYKVNDVFASYDSNCEDNVPTDAMLVKFNLLGAVSYHIQIDPVNSDVNQSSKSFNSISGDITENIKLISGNDNAGGTTRPCLLMRVNGIGGTWPGPTWNRRYGGGMLVPFVGPYYPVIPSRFFKSSDGNYVVWANYLETSLPPAFSNLIFKISSSSNAVIWARKHTFNMASILPYGEEVSDGGFIGVSYNLAGTGHDLHFIKTDNLGQAPSSCAASDVSMSSDAPSYTFVSPIYNSWTTGTVTNTPLLPVVTTITPPRNIVCFQAPCVPPPAPTVDATPNPICSGQTVTISASGGGGGVGYNVYTVPSGGTSIGTTPLNVNPTSTTTYYVESYVISNPSCVSTTRTPVTVTVNPNNTVTGPGSATVCVNTAMTPINHTTTGATGIGSPTGLPPGVTASFSSGTITVSGTPTSTGTFNYSVPLTGGCGSVNATGTITVNGNNTVTGPGSATVCVNTAMTPINHTTTGATGIGSPTGLPPGVTASFSSGTITVSGTPTSTGTFNYSVPLTGGCGSVNATGTITVNPTNTVSGPGSATVCINTAMTPINHTTTGATGIGSPSGLPPGVTASFSSGTITIIGTPTASGVFNYTIPLTGGCGSVNATGTITVNPDNSFTGTTDQTVCVNSAMTPLNITTSGATGIGSPTNLPPGVSASWSSNTLTISGTPTSTGTFNYSIPLTGGCGAVNVTGTITVISVNTVTGPNNATACINETMSPITHTTTGATGIGSPSGLPPGVTASFSSGTITISGTPTSIGNFNYSIPLTGGCGTVNATGTITVNPTNTVSGPGSATVCVNTAMTPINHTTTGATGIGSPSGLPPGVTASFSSGTITISGTPTLAGNFNYSIPLTGGCGTVNATGTITVNPDNSYTGTTNQSVCVNAAMLPLNITTSGATGIGSPTGLPNGVSATWSSGTISITGTPTDPGVYNYSIPLTGGCGVVNVTGTITVLNENQYTPPPVTYVCINQPLSPNLLIPTQGATGIGSPTNLPPGMNASFVGNDVVISGTPTVAGTYNYSIPLTGGCGSVNVIGTIEVITVNSYTGNTNLSACINQPFIDSLAVFGATGIGSPSGLPSGVNAFYNNGYVYIQGPASAAGTFNYSIPLTGGCGSVNITGTMTINPDNTILLTSAPSTDDQQLCLGSSITTITYQVSGATGVVITVPNGVLGYYDINTQEITISGTPTDPGVQNYTIELTGGCGNITATGTITVYENPIPQLTSNSPVCIGGTAQLNVSSNGSPLTYQWFDPNGNAIGNTSSIQISSISEADTGYYKVVVTVGGMCTATDSIFVSVTTPLDPVINLISLSPLCENDGFTFVVNGISGANYQWTSPQGTQYNNSMPDITNADLTDEGYWVIMVNNGCIVYDSIYVDINPLPSASLSYTPDICPNESIVITATGGVSYQWQGPNGFSSTDSVITITNPTSNDYGWFVFTITGSNGCSLTDSVSVTPQIISIEANPDTTTTDPATEVTIAVIPNDVVTSGNITIVSPPQHGSATVVNNQIVYTPNSGFAGNDTLVYMVCDLNCQQVCDTAWVRIYVYADVMVPELVTPNGDGSNDTWVINGLDKYPDHEVIIMNRWGDKIFVAKPYNNDWNGQTNVGILMGNEGKTTDGTYFYIINLSKDAEPLKGFLELRK